MRHFGETPTMAEHEQNRLDPRKDSPREATVRWTLALCPETASISVRRDLVSPLTPALSPLRGEGGPFGVRFGNRAFCILGAVSKLFPLPGGQG